ncbi:MAG: ABC transporter permease [Armatimonadetes bacterium]|nr:ABC transporter permease [Armatimonadota bacterium]
MPILNSALQSLRENWQRSVLSGLGVCMASIAIVLLVSIGLGVEKDIRSQVDDLGVNVLVAVPGHVNMNMGFNPNLGGQSYFTEAAVEAVRHVHGVEEAGILTFAGGGVRAGGKEAYPFIIACTPEWFDIHQVRLAEGRSFKGEEESKPVVVLGGSAKTLLFEGAAVGQKVQINGKPFEVIGVTQEKLQGQSMFSMQGFQNVAYIPYRYLKGTASNVQIDRIVMKTAQDAEPKALVKDVESALSNLLDDQQYSVLTQEDLLGLIYKLIGILGTLVVGLTSIGLVIGGVGIMTVMLMSVNERRKEIGVRKAVGARFVDIFGQFLIESAFIGAGGTLVGVVVSAVVAGLLASLTPIKPLVTGATVGLAFTVGLGVGSIFGLIPAIKAARQDPVVALRME